MVESVLYVQWVFRLDTILALPNRAIGKSSEAMSAFHPPAMNDSSA